VSLYFNDGVTTEFFSSGTIVFLTGLILFIITKNHDKQIQKKEVFITSFVIKNTIDERLQNILKEKKAVFEGVVEKLNDKSDYDTLFNDMDKKDLEDLIFYGQ